MSNYAEKEALRWAELQKLQDEGKIHHLRKQSKYTVTPIQIEFVDDKAKTVETPCEYIADFSYIDAKGNLHLEDIKEYEGAAYEAFEVKRKVLRYFFKMVIEQV